MEAVYSNLSKAVVTAGWFACEGACFHLPWMKSRDFTESWNRLEPDIYINGGRDVFGVDHPDCDPEGRPYPILRWRRYGKFLLQRSAGPSLRWLKNECSFGQGESNRLYVQKTRVFASLEERVAMHPELHGFLWRNLSAIVAETSDSDHDVWELAMHQIRVRSRSKLNASPAPEGPHQDNHDYISIHLIARENISGAESLIYGVDSTLGEGSGPDLKTPLHSRTLWRTMDSIFLNDRRLYHDVTPIQPVNEKEDAFRDMLLIDYEKISQSRFGHRVDQHGDRVSMIS